MKTSELTGAALDWAVAKCETTASPAGMSGAEALLYRSKATNAMLYKPHAIPYSTDWSQGGPIIDREKISIMEECNGTWMGSIGGCTDLDMPLWQEHGPTPLIAAMRCYVASKLGDDVDVPSELM